MLDGSTVGVFSDWRAFFDNEFRELSWVEVLDRWTTRLAPGFSAAATHGAVLLDFRGRLQKSDAVLISSPEYAHGVPGVLKNALDWIVGSGELVDKPVALINASPHSTHAYASLTETITVMSARLAKNACVTLPFWDKTLDAEGVASHPELSALLQKAVIEFVAAIRN